MSDTDKLPELILRVVGDRKLNVDLRPALRSLAVSQTMKGASTVTVTVSDPKGELRRSGRLARACEIELDETTWRLARVERSDDGTLTLIFEPRVVSRARARKTPRKASRSKMTRAQFIASMFAEDKKYPVDFFSPELTRRRPLASLDSKQRDATRQPGFGQGTKLYGKSATTPLNARQLRNAETALTVAEDLKASERATLALIVACIVEGPDFDNPKGGEGASSGILQLTDDHLGGSTSTNGGRRDIKKVVGLFFTEGFTGKGGAIELARKNPGWSPGRIAQECQGSAYPARYDKYRAQADKILEAFGGGVPDRSAYFGRYEFTRGQPGGPRAEDTWSAAQRLAEEVGWALFEFAGTVFYMSQADLFRSRPRATISADDEGIKSITWAVETNAKFPSEMKVVALTDVWAAPPGSVIIVEGEGPGADGRWLVESADRPNYFDDETTIQLVKPSRELPEPRGDVETRDLSTDSDGGNVSEAPAGVEPTGEWAGTKAIFDQFVTPFLRKQGLTPGGAKRTPAQNAAVDGSANSDHLTTKTNTYAVDYPTTSGEAAARALAEAMGITGWSANSYARHTVRFGGKSFSVQILWGAGIEHGDHIHVGISAT